MEPRDADELLNRHRDRFRRLVHSILTEEQGPDPFAVPLSAFKKLDDGGRAELVRRAGIIARERIDEELRSRGASWLVMIGDRVALSSSDRPTYPEPDEVLALGAEEDRVAYLFEGPLIEEIPSTSPWSPMDRDAYPTLPLTIGSDNELLVADLDTGSHATLFDSSFMDSSVATWFEGRHLGQPFLWAPATAILKLSTASGQMLERTVPTRFVRDWAVSPFVRINPARRALVGRDLLRAFGLTVTLSAPEKHTTVVTGE